MLQRLEGVKRIIMLAGNLQVIVWVWAVGNWDFPWKLTQGLVLVELSEDKDADENQIQQGRDGWEDKSEKVEARAVSIMVLASDTRSQV